MTMIDFGAPAPLPEDLEALAADENAVVGEALFQVVPVPERPYNPKVVTSLGEAVAAVAKLMGLDLGEGSFTGPQEALDQDLIRFLAMMSEAAEQYGAPLPVALADIKGDAELTALTAALLALSTDRDFKDFLVEPVPEGDAIPDLSEEDEDLEEEEFDFASRAR